MDESDLTDESYEMSKVPGACVPSGAINVETALTVHRKPFLLMATLIWRSLARRNRFASAPAVYRRIVAIRPPLEWIYRSCPASHWSKYSRSRVGIRVSLGEHANCIDDGARQFRHPDDTIQRMCAGVIAAVA
jgi:hypothetical protein